jgi:carboxypeptidase PM20D1
MKKKIISGIVMVIVLIIAVMLVKTMTFTSKQITVEEKVNITLDKMKIAGHLSDAVKIQTISYEEPNQLNADAFDTFQAFLEKTYPLIHRQLKKEKIGHALLYTWQGKDTDKKPILLLAHQDVVPVEAGAEKDWVHPGFSGAIADGFVWGRGTLDNKNALISVMESMEYLIGKGFVPDRTLYVALDDDEEVGGKGAEAISLLLQKRGIKLDYVLDEGGNIAEGMVPGVKSPVAFVGIAEKGRMTVKLTARGEGGHSSMPPAHTALGVLSRAICNIENHQFPKSLKGPTRVMFEYVGPEMTFPMRLIMANLWLTEPLLEQQLSKISASNAMIRTTAAATMAKGSARENILPPQAIGIVNVRIIPGETTQAALEYIKNKVNDSKVEIEVMGNPNDPSPVSDIDTPAFHALNTAIRQLYPDTVIAPYLLLGASDSRHFYKLTNNVYRFTPVHMKSEDLKRMHGINERIRIDDLAEIVKFYICLIKRTQ